MKKIISLLLCAIISITFMPVVTMAEDIPVPQTPANIENMSEYEIAQLVEQEKEYYSNFVRRISWIKVKKNGTIAIGVNPVKNKPVVRYELQRSTSKNFKKNVRKYTKTKYTNVVFFYNTKHLKKGRTYYYRTRVVFQLSDGTTCNSKWSGYMKKKSKVTQ